MTVNFVELVEARKAEKRRSHVTAVPSGSAPANAEGCTAYGLKALREEAAAVRAAPIGSRNTQLFNSALKLGKHLPTGALTESAIRSALADAVDSFGDWPSDSASFEGTFRSGLEKGKDDPRHAPPLQPITPAKSFVPTSPQPRPNLAPESGARSEDAPEQDVSSWAPLDLAAILSGDYVVPEPEILTRPDGRSLLYPGKVHSVAGESESLKSWLVQLAAVQCICAGQRVLYVDFEDDAASVVSRLLALGAPAAGIAEHLAYVRPTSPLGEGELAGLLGVGAALAVLDGVTEAMSMHGMDPDSNPDTAAFFALLPRPIADGGAACVLIDHVTKSREGRGRWAIGAQHKMAAINGAAYTVEIISPFGRGRHGIARIKVAKDRPGRVRAYAENASHVADLHLRSQEDGSVLGELRVPPSESPGGFRPTVLMERVSRALESTGGAGISGNAVETMVKGKRDGIRLALEMLIAEGYVGVEKVGQARMHRSVRIFRAPEETATSFTPGGPEPDDDYPP